jgi:putative nucleotidyltransferase with HDIG domain
MKRIQPIHLYVSAVLVFAVTLSAGLDWSFEAADTSRSLLGFTVLLFLGIGSEAAAIRLNVGRSSGNTSITFIPLLACVAAFGPAAGVVFFLLSGLVVEFGIRKKEFVRSVFNVAQYVAATAAGGLAFQALGGQALSTLPSGAPFPEGLVVPLVAFGFIFLLCNHGFVSLAIAISERRDFAAVLRRVASESGGSILSDVIASPIGLLVAFLYHNFWLGGLVFSLLPLFLMRNMYLEKQKVEDANRDLLTALVKAIEVRDEYTSGHSMRVQDLSTLIGHAISLPDRKVDDLRRSALLHDIGKIEVIYEQILMKPGKLTDEEWRVMQSHVTRGVDILRSLSSFDEKIISAVRHHHENFDGTGYPDGVAGHSIPIYARIIKVADAIDAMLSDRPYRPAMTAERVTGLLVGGRGSEFDPSIIDAVLKEDLIKKHEAEMKLTQHAAAGQDRSQEAYGNGASHSTKG